MAAAAAAAEAAAVAAAGWSSDREGTLAARVSIFCDLAVCGVAAGSRIGLVLRLFENFFRLRLRAARAPKPAWTEST